MQQLLKLFWDICVLRKGPQDVPASYPLFWLLLGVALILDLIIATYYIGWQQALGVVFVNTAVLFVVVVVLLSVLGYASRILQTLITLIGTGLVFSLLRLPLMLLAGLAPQNGGIFGFTEVILLVWGLLVIAHILRHALAIHLMLAGVLAFGYFMLSYQLVNLFIPQAS